VARREDLADGLGEGRVAELDHHRDPVCLECDFPLHISPRLIYPNLQELRVFWTRREFPLARAIGDELVVLDERSRIAHRLGADATAVWRCCDGRLGPPEIAAATAIAPDRVGELLDQLAERDLVACEEATPGQTRRAMLGRMVGTGVGLSVGIPAITSIMLLTPAEAYASGGGNNSGQGPTPSGPETTPTTTTTKTTPGTQTTTTTTTGTKTTTGTQTTPGGGSTHAPISTGTTTTSAPGSTSVPGSTTTGSPTSAPGRIGTTTNPKSSTTAAPTPGSSVPGSGGGGPPGTSSGSNIVRLPAGTLPFTGDDLARQTALGAAAVAAGLAIRRAAEGRAAAEPPGSDAERVDG
jgi:hypothetical protein